MPDTTLLHLITGHTVRTTSSVDAVLAALKPTALADHGLVRLADAHGRVVCLRPEHESRKRQQHFPSGEHWSLTAGPSVSGVRWCGNRAAASHARAALARSVAADSVLPCCSSRSACASASPAVCSSTSAPRV
jgi:hypothetical protein